MQETITDMHTLWHQQKQEALTDMHTLWHQQKQETITDMHTLWHQQKQEALTDMHTIISVYLIFSILLRFMLLSHVTQMNTF